jgi:HSP20 family protein
MATTLTRKEEAFPVFEEFFTGDPFATLATWRRGMNALLDSALRVPALVDYSLPAMDLYNKDSAYVVEMALPGLDKKDISIEVEGNRLTVSGKYQIETPEVEKEKAYHHRELRRGQFARSITFPEDIEAAKVIANFDRGILKIQIPSLRPVEPKKVAIT